ncbi:MAG TPA: outer membrane beta-barrel protein [Gemmatimonas sp.]|nr:outer membrane beta-barrel protein [Gemmatimonas sp.]
MRLSVRLAALAFAAVVPAAAHAQAPGRAGSGLSLTPYAGYLVTGTLYDGPLGTDISKSNAPMVGVQGSMPLGSRLALVGNVAYASGELQIGVPVLGGINVGTARTYLYDAGLELGGLGGRAKGFAPFVQAGIGGMTTDLERGVVHTRSSNIAYSAGVGLDIGVSNSFALRVQAKDWIGRFDSQEAVGFRTNTNLAHNWALTAGVKFAF